MPDDARFMLLGEPPIILIELGGSSVSLDNLVDAMQDRSSVLGDEIGTVVLTQARHRVVRIEHQANGATVAFHFLATEGGAPTRRILLRPIIGWRVDASGKTIAIARADARTRIGTFAPALKQVAKEALAELGG